MPNTQAIQIDSVHDCHVVDGRFYFVAKEQGNSVIIGMDRDTVHDMVLRYNQARRNAYGKEVWEGLTIAR